MPRPRWFGGTKRRRVDEKIPSSATVIPPACGRSSPAIERSVVVLPQPLGPSSVKSLPGGTSNDTSCAARIACLRSFTYSVHKPLTVSISKLADAEAPTDPLRGQHPHEEGEDEHDAERRELDVLA